MDTRQKNIDAQKRWGDEVAGQGRLDVLDEILADDFVDHDSGDYAPTREGLKDFFRDFRTAFPDLALEVEEMVATDDYVAFRYTARGTHRGEFMGHAPTGRSIEAPAMQLGKWRDGRCTDRWGVTDQSKILEQLGLLDA